PVFLPGELGEGAQAVLALGLGLRLVVVAGGPAAHLRAVLLNDLEIDSLVPDVDVALCGQLPHLLAVCPSRRGHHLAALPLLETAIPAGYRKACDEPLHVPFERSGVGLIEVVDVEDHPPVRSSEGAEVGEM